MSTDGGFLARLFPDPRQGFLPYMLQGTARLLYFYALVVLSVLCELLGDRVLDYVLEQEGWLS